MNVTKNISEYHYTATQLTIPSFYSVAFKLQYNRFTSQKSYTLTFRFSMHNTTT